MSAKLISDKHHPQTFWAHHGLKPGVAKLALDAVAVDTGTTVGAIQ
jgi:hypothetical protein